MAEAFWEDFGMKLTFWGPLSPLSLSLAVLVFAIDQAHKWWMIHILVWNQGVSYGLLKTHAQGLLIGVSLIVTVVLWIWSCRSNRPVAVAALGLVIGGALGNALDRYLYGAVADFFHLHWGSLSWYVFNVADMAIVAGVALLLYESFKERSAA
jgi:signal peptidase II